MAPNANSGTTPIILSTIVTVLVIVGFALGGSVAIDKKDEKVLKSSKEYTNIKLERVDETLDRIEENLDKLVSHLIKDK